MRKLQKAQVILDSITIGKKQDVSVVGMTHATGLDTQIRLSR